MQYVYDGKIPVTCCGVVSVIYLKAFLLKIPVSNYVEYFRFYAHAVSQMFAE